MHTIQINDDCYRVPESWDELTEKQLSYLVNLTQSDIPIEELKVHMMLYCLNAHVYRYRDIYRHQVKISIGTSGNKVPFRLPVDVRKGYRNEIPCTPGTNCQSLSGILLPVP